MGIIATIIFSIIFGVFSPILPLGANLPLNIGKLTLNDRSLLSQIGSQLTNKGLSELNPIEALGNVTAPLDAIWNGLNQYIDTKHIFSKPSNSALEGRLDVEGTLRGIDNLSMGRALEIAKSAFILVANILVAVLEIALWLLRGILGYLR